MFDGDDDINCDDHLDTPEPFFAESLPCESCGKPVDSERKKAWWDADLLVGPCCIDPLFDDVPVEATCEGLCQAVLHCKTVAAVRLAMSMHLAECKKCQKLFDVPKIEPAYETLTDGSYQYSPTRRAA